MALRCEASVKDIRINRQGGNVRQLFVLCSALLLLSANFTTAEAAPFKITSTAAADQGALPVLYTCDDKNISPKITWSGKPAQTKSYALIVSDPDAPNGVFYHWVLFNLPTSLNTLEEGVTRLPANSKVGDNSWGKTAYNGPCPPKGTSHHYVFTLYALDKKLNLAEGTDAPKLMAVMKNHILDKTSFVAVYTRW
jgi:Raf kinase inhibitor-like YbhB/YbcL family protein